MRQIPSTGGIPHPERGVLEAMKENIEEIRGVRSGKVAALPSTASTSDVIKKINELLTRLQG